jgi:DNA-binding HxlR family transcriptional regulator
VSDASLHVTEQCKPITELLGRIGDKWTMHVVVSLRDGSRRFSEIHRGLPGVSQRMLTLTLRGLECDGLISRKVTPTIPPPVDYELTTLGRSLQTQVSALAHWARENEPHIQAARAAFNANGKAAANLPGGDPRRDRRLVSQLVAVRPDGANHSAAKDLRPTLPRGTRRNRCPKAGWNPHRWPFASGCLHADWMAGLATAASWIASAQLPRSSASPAASGKPRASLPPRGQGRCPRFGDRSNSRSYERPQ